MPSSQAIPSDVRAAEDASPPDAPSVPDPSAPTGPSAPLATAGALPRLVARESLVMRAASAVLVLIVTGLFFANAWAHFVPVHGGTDQNGYLFGGRLFAQTLTMRYSPMVPGTAMDLFDVHQFIGSMWVGADFGRPTESYYPKYPLGLPLLYATSLWIGGESRGPLIAYWLNPVAMTLAVVATYLLARKILRPTFALLAAAVFATSPVTMGLTTNPNSHAAAVCCVTWGMLMLVDFFQKRGAWRAIIAGLLLGYAATIRYSEGALILPVAFVAIMNLPLMDPTRRWRDLRAWRQSWWLVFCWSLPIIGLVAYNRAAIGAWTGYDPTNESTGFSLAYAADNWETLIRHLNTHGLSLLLPFATGGLILMFWWSWRFATLIVLWTVPCLLTYLSYYWAPDPQQPAQISISYLRFFLTVLPALAIGAFWLGQFAVDHVKRPALAMLATGALAAVAIAMHLQNALPLIENDQVTRLALQTSANEVLDVAPAGSVLLVSEYPLLHHLQFAREYTLYAPQTFDRNYIQGLLSRNVPDEPDPIDPARRESLFERLKDKDQKQLDDDQRSLIARALDNNLRVFAVLPRRQNDPPARRRRQLAAGAALAGDGPGLAKFVPDPNFARIITPDRFEVEVLAAWNNIAPRPAEAPRPRGARQRPVAARGAAVSYQLVEITKKPYVPPPPPPPRAPAKPPATKPAPKPAAPIPAAKPATTRPATAVESKPAATKPSATRPAESKLATTKPVETKPAESRPAATPPASTAPAAAPPATSPATPAPATQP